MTVSMFALLVALPGWSGRDGGGGPARISEPELRALVTTGADRRSHPSGARVVNFWATWCAPCVAELPLLLDWASRHPEVELTLVNVDLPSASGKVGAFLEEHGLGAPGIRSLQLASDDPATTLLEIVEGWPDQLPVTLVLRPDGTRAGAFAAAITSAELDAAVARALDAGRVPPPPSLEGAAGSDPK